MNAIPCMLADRRPNDPSIAHCAVGEDQRRILNRQLWAPTSLLPQRRLTRIYCRLSSVLLEPGTAAENASNLKLFLNTMRDFRSYRILRDTCSRQSTGLFVLSNNISSANTRHRWRYCSRRSICFEFIPRMMIRVQETVSSMQILCSGEVICLRTSLARRHSIANRDQRIILCWLPDPWCK